MKILFLISSLSSGGAERVLSNLANHLSAEHEVTIATFSIEEPFYNLSQTLKHIKLNLFKSSYSKLNQITNTYNRIVLLTRTIQDYNPDVIISFMTHMNILSIIAAKITGKKIIISERITYDFWTARELIFLRKLIYPFSECLVVQTFQEKEKYYFVKNVEVIHNPIALQVNIPKKEQIILAVGRCEKQKSFDKLITAFRHIKKSNWELWIVGSGSQKSNLESLAKLYRLDNVKFFETQKNIFDYYAKASIFVLSSVKEGFPNVLLEAMSCGCACISFDCPSGPREIINHKINGLLVEDQNTQKLAEAIEGLIEDENMRKQLAHNAINVRKKYSINTIANEWINLIMKVISK